MMHPRLKLAGLAASALLLTASAAWIARSLLLPLELPPTVIPPAGESPMQSGSRSVAVAPENLSAGRAALAERPLFEPERRPFVVPLPPAPVVAAPAPAPPPPPSPPMRSLSEQGWQLAGTLVDGPARIAYFRTPGSAGTKRLAEGESVLGWRVERIEAGRVVLVQGGREEILTWPKQAAPAGQMAGRPPPQPVSPQRR